MTRDEVIKLAREAADPETADPLHNDMVTLMVWELERFAALVAAAEREACAVVAESTVRKQYEHVNGGRPFTDHMHWEDIAAAIRARGES